MEPQSLAQRNLLRNLAFRVPSGQSVAKAMASNLLDPADLADLKPFALDKRTLLWFYILREAGAMGQGKHLNYRTAADRAIGSNARR